MSNNYEFEGWMGLDPKSVDGNMVWQKFEPKPFTEDDVDIEVSHCGICGSDLHVLRSGWYPTPYPCLVGHEIVGRAVRVGKNVGHVKTGDRVGVGAQSESCLKPDCEMCTSDNENYCPHMAPTYGAKFQDGSKTYGGYADYNRTPGHFVIKIPDGVSSEEAAPMLCGGITVFSPLMRNGAGPGKRVGIVGVGGLGHFGVLFAKALGCDKVYGISRSASKAEDVKKMGADVYIATEEDPNWADKHANSLDLIVSTVSSPKMPLGDYLKLLRPFGQFIQVGAPEDELPRFSAFSLIGKGVKVGGSGIGSPKEIQEMLQFAAEKKVHPWVQPRSMKEANPAVIDMEKGKARYRYVLVNEKHAK